jgi:hypothetical protein
MGLWPTAKKMKTENSYVYFSLSVDNFNPESVTTRLDITPTEIWKKGEIGKYRQQLDFACWNFSTDKRKTELIVDNLVNEIINKLFEKVEIINELKSQYQLESTLEIVLYVETNPDESTPTLGFDSKTIEFLYLTKTKVDVDIYRLNSEAT